MIHDWVVVAMAVRTGAERLAGEPGLVDDGRLGLITNPTGVLPDLPPTVGRAQAAGLPLTALFGPEHGMRGTAQARRERVRHDRPQTPACPSSTPTGRQARPGRGVAPAWTRCCSTSRTSAPASTPTSGRCTTAAGRRAARHARSSCSTGPTRSAAYESRAAAAAGLRELRRPRPAPGPPRPDRGRARPAVRSTASGRSRWRAGRATRCRDRAAVGAAVAEHADARHRVRLPGHRSLRGHQPLRGPRHHPAVRAGRRAVRR